MTIGKNLELPVPLIAEICRRYHVRELAAFGSVLSASFGQTSDVDLLVEFEPDVQVGFLTLSRLARELSELLGRRADVVSKGGLKPAIRRGILAQAKVLYAA
jgi:predicted nucleotidyltransferase